MDDPAGQEHIRPMNAMHSMWHDRPVRDRVPTAPVGKAKRRSRKNIRLRRWAMPYEGVRSTATSEGARATSQRHDFLNLHTN